MKDHYKSYEELLQDLREREQALDSQRRPKRHVHDHEHKLQAKCVAEFDRRHPDLRFLLFAIPNGGKRDAKTAAKLKAEGVRAGVADLFLAVPRSGYHGVFIEMKTKEKGSRQRASQEEFEKAVTAQGFLYVISRTFEHFNEFTDSYLNGPNTQPTPI